MILLDTINNKGLISDASLSFEELQQLQTRSFAELLPVLEELEKRDLIQKIPNDGTTTYKVSPLLPEPESSSTTDWTEIAPENQYFSNNSWKFCKALS